MLLALATATLFDDEPTLGVLRGCSLTIIADDYDEEEEFVDESMALQMLDSKGDPLSIVRQLFLPEKLQELRTACVLGGDACAPAECGLEVLQPAHVVALERNGHAVIDGVLDAASATATGAEALRLARDTEHGGFQQAGQVGRDADVRDDRTCFLSGKRSRLAP